MRIWVEHSHSGSGEQDGLRAKSQRAAAVSEHRRGDAAAIALLICWGASLLACHTPRARDAGWLGDTHVPADSAAVRDTTPGASAPMSVSSVSAAQAALERALRRGPAADVVAYANRLLALGGHVDAERWNAVQRAVDEVPGPALEALWAVLSPTYPPAAHVALRLALRADHLGDTDAALVWLDHCQMAAAGAIGADGGANVDTPTDSAGDVSGTVAIVAQARRLRRDIRSRDSVDSAVIAVLLPLSGHFASLGAELQAAIALAGQEAGDVQLAFLDTAGAASGAVKAVDEAVHRHRVVAILGPVGMSTSRAAAARAAELGVPIALLAPAADAGSGAAPAAGVFRLWSSAYWEAGEAARLAVAAGHARLAALAPRDEHGQRAVEAFSATATALGAEVVARGFYDPTGTDLEPDIRSFLQLDPATNPRLRRHLLRRGRKAGWKTFSPDIAFDLLYIPDEYQRAALVASYLPYFNVELRTREFMDAMMLRRKHRGRVPQVVQLLGSSGWHHPGLIPRGGAAVEGALVVDIFAAGAGEDASSEEAAQFAVRFRDSTGRVPSAVAAQAYDAATLLFAARRRIGERNPRAHLVAVLTDARLVAGVCGPARIAQGAIARTAMLLRVDSGAFVLHGF